MKKNEEKKTKSNSVIVPHPAQIVKSLWYLDLVVVAESDDVLDLLRMLVD